MLVVEGQQTPERQTLVQARIEKQPDMVTPHHVVLQYSRHPQRTERNEGKQRGKDVVKAANQAVIVAMIC